MVTIGQNEPMTFRVLMVCTGNICRSTMAQQVLQEQVDAAGLDVAVDSAGISNEEQGNRIDPRAEQVLREFGHGVPDHRARRIGKRELADSDLVLAMTRYHMDNLRMLAARQGQTPEVDAPIGDSTAVDLRMYRAFDPDVPGVDGTDGVGRTDLDVPDPWYGGHEDFVETLQTIERVTPAIVDHIAAKLRP